MGFDKSGDMDRPKATYCPREISQIDDENAFADFAQPYFVKRADLSKLYKTLIPRPDDTYVATVPKCGTTWTIKIVEHLIGKAGNYVGGGLTMSEPVKWLETAFAFNKQNFVETLNAAEGTRYFKSHSCVGLLPKPENDKIKVIVCTRHPLDCFVSLWHHTRRDPSFEYDRDFQAFFRELCLMGYSMSGHQMQFYEEYLTAAEKNEIDLCMVSFETMKTPKGAVESIDKLAEFLGVKEYDAEKIAIDTSFGSMRKLMNDTGMLVPKPGGDAVQPMPSTSEGSKDSVSSAHIRQGKAGGWVDYLDTEDLKLWRNYVNLHAGNNPKTVEYFGLDFLLC